MRRLGGVRKLGEVGRLGGVGRLSVVGILGGLSAEVGGVRKWGSGEV